MITTILRSTKFIAAACTLCVGGFIATPFAVHRDYEKGDNNFPRGYCAVGISGLGMIVEYAAIIAHFS